MADDRFTQNERDNAGVLHFLLTPLRMLMEIGKVVLFVSGLLFLLFYRQIGWVINVGPRSQSARQERAGLISAHLKQYNGEENDDGREWAQYDVDFRHQPDPDADLDSWNRYWPDDKLSWVESFVWDGTANNHRVKAFTTNLDRAYGTGRHGIPYCAAGLSPGRFDSSPGNWDTRWDDALDRKASRMQRDYEVAAMMTASLRYTLATLKLHRPLDVRPANYCDANQGDSTYRRTLMSIILWQAPVVRIRYISIPDYDADTHPAHGQYQAEIMGFCNVQDCHQPLLWGTTCKDDLFAPDAPLTDEQMVAERDMLDMVKETFWLQAARAYGLTDLMAVKEAHQRALQDLNREFVAANYQI